MTKIDPQTAAWERLAEEIQNIKDGMFFIKMKYNLHSNTLASKIYKETNCHCYTNSPWNLWDKVMDGYMKYLYLL